MIEHVPIIALSTLLDPRFKNLHFKNAQASGKAVSFLRRVISEKMQSSSSGSENDGVPRGKCDFWLYHKVLVQKDRKRSEGRQGDELSLYLKNPMTPLKSNPIETWEDMKEVFPRLYRQFRQYAVVVATSVPLERFFSEAGENTSKKST
ncbi:unnamed protein product [Lasius platythorax]|uniref:HAT C-terminal dimerisation domain-containing protein n=1 Tax=Lasius platythorax TaxID=488582 RepID=A0AAV2MZ63_9HYME